GLQTDNFTAQIRVPDDAESVHVRRRVQEIRGSISAPFHHNPGSNRSRTYPQIYRQDRGPCPVRIAWHAQQPAYGGRDYSECSKSISQKSLSEVVAQTVCE